MNVTEHEQMVDDCEKRESRLTDGQRTLIDSYGKQLRDGRSLTKRQAEVLEDIWEAATARG